MEKVNLLEISDPSFIKKLNNKELIELSKDIREFLIDNISKTGGHLASNLGAVELTIALHKVFDSPKDRFIFDVGHQSYTHKILTGRAKDFVNLRKFGGLSGYAKRSESVHDHFEAGHSSTSISAISGFDCDNDNYNIAIIGDASLASGLAFEGLNYLGSLKDKKAIVVINDNKMAISKSVGAMPNILSKIRGRGMKIKKFLYKILPGFLISFCQAVVRFSRKLFGSANMFEHMGFVYMGPVDGNDIESVVKVLKKAKKLNRPCVLHLITEKGRGYSKAETDISGDFHGVNPFDVKTGMPLDQTNRTSWSEIISEIIIKMSEKENITVIVPAMINGSKLLKFQKLYPDRLIDVGIAEEHAVTMATAVSLSGHKVFVPIYSTFAQRAYDEILHDCAHHNTNVVLGIDRAGIVGEDGETHQGIYDVAMLSHIPNMMILSPSNEKEAYGLLSYAFKQNCPVAIRYPRGYYDCDLTKLECDDIDRMWTIVKEGSKLVVISYGSLINDLLSIDLDIMIVNARFIKPYDCDMLDQIFALNKRILVIEEVVNSGSLAMNILDYANNKKQSIDLVKHNLKDQFIVHGSIKDVKKSLGFDVDSLRKIIEENICD